MSVTYESHKRKVAMSGYCIRLEQVRANFGTKLSRKPDSNFMKILMVDNLEIRNVGCSATPADKSE